MGERKYVLIFTFLFCLNSARAQVQTFELADSTSATLFGKADWSRLTGFGEQAIRNGIDFPELRTRMGYAYMMTGNYKAALNSYDQVFKNNSYNQDARYYAYLCHLYLNQEPGASYNGAYLDAGHQQGFNLSSFHILNTGLETGIKYNNNYYRGTAAYSRIFLQTRLNWKLTLDLSAIYYGQPVANGVLNDSYNSTTHLDRQFEYYARLRYAITENIIILGAYHYLNTNYLDKTYNSHIGLLGLKYTGTYFDLQADVNFGNMIDKKLQQYNAGITWYPLGNLNLYAISRESYQHEGSNDRIIFDERAGFKLMKNTWLESSATFSNLDDYIDADALYIYNAIDVSKLKLGETAFYQIGKHAQLQLNYSLEKKTDATHSLNYNQYAITAGILWKF